MAIVNGGGSGNKKVKVPAFIPAPIVKKNKPMEERDDPVAAPTPAAQTAAPTQSQSQSPATPAGYAPAWIPDVLPARRPSGDRWINEEWTPPVSVQPSGFGTTPSSGSIREQDRDLAWSLNLPQPTRRPTGDRFINEEWTPPTLYQGRGSGGQAAIDRNNNPFSYSRRQTGDRNDQMYGQTVRAPNTIPTGSFLAANGQTVRAPNPYEKYMPTKPANTNIPTGSFLAANGQAVRVPNPYEKYMPTGQRGFVRPASTSGYSGGYSSGGWGRGGGWGGWDDYEYTPKTYAPNTYAPREYDPQMGLFSWNFKG